MRQSPLVAPTAAESLRSTSQPGHKSLTEVLTVAASDDGGTLSPTDISGLAKCATELIVAVTGVDLSGLAMFHPEGSARMVAASRHRSMDWGELVIPPGDGVAGQVLKRGGSVAVKNYAQESGSSTHLIDVFAHHECAYGMLAVPIEQSGSIVGVVYGGVRRAEYIGDRGRTGLNNVAKLFSAALLPFDRLNSDESSKTERPDSPKSDLIGGVALSTRERRILKLLGDGLSTCDVANTEFLAVNTVRSYVQSALWKLGAHSRLQAVAIAREAGLI